MSTWPCGNSGSLYRRHLLFTVPTYCTPKLLVNVSLGDGAKPAVDVSKIEATSGLVTSQLAPPRRVLRWITLETSTILTYRDSYFSLMVSPRAVLKSHTLIVPALLRRPVKTSRAIPRLIYCA